MDKFHTYNVKLHFQTSCELEIVAKNIQDAKENAFEFVGYINTDEINTTQSSAIKNIIQQLIDNKHTIEFLEPEVKKL